MTLADRGAPGVRIVSVASARGPAGAPLDLAGRILSFSYEDSDLKADQVTLQLDNFDLALFERTELAGGALLEVSWGYPGHMASPRRVVVKKLKGFQTLTVEGLALSVLLHRIARTRGWHHQRRSDVARAIAAEHGYTGEFVDIEDTALAQGTINQVAETDARLLRRLAAREGFVFLVDDAGFHFRRRNHAAPPTHVLTWYADPGRGDLISVNVESDLARRVGRVEVRGRDPMAKTTITAHATADSVDRSTLGDVVEVVDPELGGTSLQRRNATASVHPTSASTAGQAAREANARFRGAERGTVKLSAQAVGDPTLRAKTVIELRGLSRLLSGKYYISEAKHQVTSGSYVVELQLTSDGIGRRLSGGKSQGGVRNRHVVSNGMTEIEVVDPERGGTQIQYRPRAGLPGAADPEAQRSKP